MFHYGLKTAFHVHHHHPQCRSTHSIPHQTALHAAHQSTSFPTLQVMNVPLRSKDRPSTFITSTPQCRSIPRHPPTNHPPFHSSAHVIPTLQVMNVPLRSKDRLPRSSPPPTMPQHSLHPPRETRCHAVLSPCIVPRRARYYAGS